MTALGDLLTTRLNALRKEQSLRRSGFLSEQKDQAETTLNAVEDSLVVVLEKNRLGVTTPRVQQKVERLRRRIEIWTITLQALRSEEIRMAATASSDIPDVYAVAPATDYDRRTGYGMIKIVLLSILAGLSAFIFLKVIDRAPRRTS